MLYTKHELHRTYEIIALERPHKCDECGTENHLSHSHLAPKSLYGHIATKKENIVYHCLSINKEGCHDKYAGVNVAKMKNFEKYFAYLYLEAREHFWNRIHSLDDTWRTRDMEVWKRVRALLKEMTEKEQHEK